MNKAKTLSMMAVATLTTFMTTSCFNDDENTNNSTINYLELTDQQQQEMMNKLNGEFDTYVYFTDANTQKTDSVSVRWEMNAKDSTATCTNFPLNILRHYVVSDDIKAALDAVGRQSITFKFYADAIVVKEYYQKDNYFYYLKAPENAVKFEYTKEGEEADGYVSIEFSNQFTGYNTVYTQMVQLYHGKLYGGLLISIVEANKVANRITCIIPFQ